MERHDDRRRFDDHDAPDERERAGARDVQWERSSGEPDVSRRQWGGGARYQQAHRQPGFAAEGAFDSRSARGGPGGRESSPGQSEASYGASRYGQVPGTSAVGRGEAQRAPQYGGPRHDDEAWLQDQGYPRLGRGFEPGFTQVEHGPYAGGTQQGGPQLGQNRADRGRSSRGDRRSLGGPHVGRGPRGYRRSDVRILEDVNERLTAHDQIDATDLDVEVRDGDVHLHGTVPDGRTRRLAEEVAEGVSGVRDVVNRLRVAGRDAWDRPGEPGPSALGHTYQGGGSGVGTGGLDVSYRGAATASATGTGGPIATGPGSTRSTGGMPVGAGIGSDQGLMGSSGGRGTGTFESGRSGDVAAAAMSERESAPMGSATPSGGSVGGGSTSTGGSTASPDARPADER